MNILFEETKFGPLFLKNRFVRSATSENLSDENGWPSQSMIQIYTDLAKNCVGMINTGVIRPRKSWFGSYNVPTLENNKGISAFKRLTDSAHRFEAKITAQLSPYFARDGKFLAPTSPLPGLQNSEEEPLEATIEDINTAISLYGELAGRLREANFDAVQIHAAHGYGLHQFLSPFTNRRHDLYGGSLRNRFRIIKNISKSIASAAGGDFPIWIKLTTGDYLDGAMEIDEVVKIATLLDEARLIAVEPSCGSIIGGWKSRGPDDKRLWKEGYNLDRIIQIKKAVNIPVVAVGGIRSFEMAEEMINNKMADFISMSRPFLIEPNIIERWQEGDLLPSKCDTCNACFDYFWNMKPLRCVNNLEYWNKIIH